MDDVQKRAIALYCYKVVRGVAHCDNFIILMIARDNEFILTNFNTVHFDRSGAGTVAHKIRITRRDFL